MISLAHPVVLLFLVIALSSGCASNSVKNRLGLHSWRDRGKVKSTVLVSTVSAPIGLREAQGLGLVWPLSRVVITSRYGTRGSDMHEGIDLKAAPGTPIKAAQAGWVVYAGNQIRGYGRLVVLRHSNQVSTVYAHNSRLLVKEGQSVQQGDIIAHSGSSGRSSGPHLHFEVRRGQNALDPLQAVGGRMPAVAQSDVLSSTRSARKRK